MTTIDTRPVEIALHEQACAHEAKHCAAALVQGLDVTGVEAPYYTLDARPEDEAGMTWVEGLGDPDGVWAMAIAVLAPHYDHGDRKGLAPDEFGNPLWEIKGPPFPLATLPGDEDVLVDLVAGFTEDEWRALVTDTYLITSSARYKRIRDALEHVLMKRQHLTRDEVLQVKAIADDAPFRTIETKAHDDTYWILCDAADERQDQKALDYTNEYKAVEITSFPC